MRKERKDRRTWGEEGKERKTKGERRRPGRGMQTPSELGVRLPLGLLEPLAGRAVCLPSFADPSGLLNLVTPW